MVELAEIVSYQVEWSRQFDEIRSRIADKLGSLATRVEHIGSTAVPGLAAKPIIDLDVVIGSIADFPEVRDLLGDLGYSHIGDLGILGREAFDHPANINIVRHNLYVCCEGGEELGRHLRFRDFLRSDKEAAADYQRLKLELARRFRANRDAYTEGKTKFIERALAAAASRL